MFFPNRAGRFWPKTGCDDSGQNCESGQSVDPCNEGGCDPPADTKVEFFFPPSGDPGAVWYDVSLVDGYSLAAEIVPSIQQDSCIPTHCALSFDLCPQDENDVGNLQVRSKDGSRVIYCLAPCKSKFRRSALSAFNFFYLKNGTSRHHSDSADLSWIHLECFCAAQLRQLIPNLAEPGRLLTRNTSISFIRLARLLTLTHTMTKPGFTTAPTELTSKSLSALDFFVSYVEN